MRDSAAKPPTTRPVLETAQAPAKIGHWSSPPANRFWTIVSNAKTLYARSAQGMLWYDDLRASWLPVPSNPGGAWYCEGLTSGCASPASPLYAIANSSLYVSVDGCRSWMQRSLPPGFQLGFLSAIAAATDLPQTVYLFNFYWQDETRHGYALWASFDEGQTWTPPLHLATSGAMGGAVHHALVYDGSIFMACWTGVFRWDVPDDLTTDVVSVRQLTKHAGLHAMAVSSIAEHIAAAGRVLEDEKYHLQVSKDGGTTWTNVDPFPHRFLVDDLLFVEDLLFARVGHWPDGKFAESVLMTDNAGETWTDVTTPELAAILAAADGQGMFPTIGFPREGLAFGAGRLFVLFTPSGFYSADLSSLRALAPSRPASAASKAAQSTSWPDLSQPVQSAPSSP
jgi:hypothetical protein